MKCGWNKMVMYALLGVVVVLVLLVPTILLLKNNVGGKMDGGGEAEYRDSECGVVFDHPRSWIRSGNGMTLPQEPLSQVVFDEPESGYKSLFAFFCYDAAEYTFEQFYPLSDIDRERSEVVTVGIVKWQRMGNFAYAVMGDRLLIMQMFFTKLDIKPKAEYEQMFVGILGSVRGF